MRSIQIKKIKEEQRECFSCVVRGIGRIMGHDRVAKVRGKENQGEF